MALTPYSGTIAENGRELQRHGTVDFPVGCYHDDLTLEHVSWHWHEELEAVVIAQGSAVVAAGDRKEVLHAGEGFFINGQVPHACWDHAHSGSRFHCLTFLPGLVSGGSESVFHGKYIRPILENQGLSFLKLSPEMPWQARALEAIEDSWQACVQEPEGYEFRVRGALSEFALLLWQNMPALSPEDALRRRRNAERIKTMLQYIQDHFDQKLDTRDIAASAAVCERECLRCFRSAIGMPPIQYLRQYRIERAARMLISSSDKIGDIAAACGFQDVSYFTKTFREIMGCAPGQYRSRGGEG